MTPPLTCWLFRDMLFDFHVVFNFPAFLLLLVSNFILSLLEKILDIFFIFLNLLRLVLWPKMWSIPENFQCSIEKNIYSGDVRWNVLYTYVRFISSIVFKSSVSLLMLCLVDLSVVEWGVKVHNCYCIAFHFYFLVMIVFDIFTCSNIKCINILNYYSSSMNWIFIIIWWSSHVTSLNLKSIHCGTSVVTLAFFWLPFA